MLRSAPQLEQASRFTARTLLHTTPTESAHRAVWPGTQWESAARILDNSWWAFNILPYWVNTPAIQEMNARGGQVLSWAAQ